MPKNPISSLLSSGNNVTALIFINYREETDILTLLHTLETQKEAFKPLRTIVDSLRQAYLAVSIHT